MYCLSFWFVLGYGEGLVGVVSCLNVELMLGLEFGWRVSWDLGLMR